MDKTPRISVIIPVYNGSNYLEEAILSVFSQTYKNYELIVVNDGSNDEGKTSKILGKYSEYLNIINQVNAGCGAALNAGLRIAKGKYIAWLSHDDIFTQNHLSIFDDYMGLKEDNAIYISNWSQFDAKYSILNEKKMSFSQIFKKIHPAWPLLLQSKINGCSMLVPKSSYNKILGFREDLRTTQDYDAWLKLLPNSKLIFTEEVTLYSRIHQGQGSLTISEHSLEADEIYSRIIREFASNYKEEPNFSAILMSVLNTISTSNYQQSKILLKQLMA